MLTVLLAAAALAAAEPLTEGPIENVAEGFQFTEGPLWLSSGELIFSDIPADTIFRADKTVFRRPSGKSNGLTLDREGRLIACEHGNRRVSRTAADGTVEILADKYQGKKFNSPNDAVAASNGFVFFTDPPYGLEGREAELPYSGVFAVAPDGGIKLLADDFKKPNGIALSPDERTLYVADTEGGHVRAFDVAADGAVSNGRVLCAVPGADGMKVDARGRLWCTASDGVRVFEADGTPLGVVEFPQAPANCAFGDADGRTLYVTARTAVYRVRCAAPGLRPGGKP